MVRRGKNLPSGNTGPVKYIPRSRNGGDMYPKSCADPMDIDTESGIFKYQNKERIITKINDATDDLAKHLIRKCFSPNTESNKLMKDFDQVFNNFLTSVDFTQAAMLVLPVSLSSGSVRVNKTHIKPHMLM